MFTGLIEARTSVRRVEACERGLRAWIAAPDPSWVVREGQSIAVSGACLSVAHLADPKTGVRVDREQPGADMVFELSAETLARTWFERFEPGIEVNLERSLRVGDRLDGHLVAGHVDGLGAVIAIDDSRDGGRRMRIEIDRALQRYLIDKGSITIDGVSLTVVEPAGACFDVALIPITLARTTLGDARVGRTVNVEVDMIGKWIEKFVVR